MKYTFALLAIFALLVSAVYCDDEERTIPALREPMAHLMRAVKEGVKSADKFLDLLPSG
uniref:Uncharacterized protein n=1 Tax=Anopheles albimanus TaxID=7167 RepID=A0A182FWY8_ANOAL